MYIFTLFKKNIIFKKTKAIIMNVNQSNNPGIPPNNQPQPVAFRTRKRQREALLQEAQELHGNAGIAISQEQRLNALHNNNQASHNQLSQIILSQQPLSQRIFGQDQPSDTTLMHAYPITHNIITEHNRLQHNTILHQRTTREQTKKLATSLTPERLTEALPETTQQPRTQEITQEIDAINFARNNVGIPLITYKNIYNLAKKIHNHNTHNPLTETSPRSILETSIAASYLILAHNLYSHTVNQLMNNHNNLMLIRANYTNQIQRTIERLQNTPPPAPAAE
jgi:endonuclease III